jgi:hypothetical protein
MPRDEGQQSTQLSQSHAHREGLLWGQGRALPVAAGKVGKGSTAAGRVWATWVRYRRVSSVAVRPGEGPLTERTAATQSWRRERVFMPLSDRSDDEMPPRLIRSGWQTQDRDG